MVNSVDIKESLFQVLDCTIRDGGYLNNWKFENQIVREVYRTCSKAGIDFVEIGFRGSEKYFDKDKYGIWRFSPDEMINEVIDGICGTKISVMGDYGKIDVNDFVEKKNSPVDMVRIAAHKNNIAGAIGLLAEIKDKGYITSLQAMGFVGYSESERSALMQMINNAELDYFYIADSYGSMFPSQIDEMFMPFIELENVRVGFHSHNNLQMAFANTLEAIRSGVHIIDGSIYGMGRAAGNLPIEIFIAHMEVLNEDKYNVVPILNCINKYFVSLKKENPWGYQLPYMISGMYRCHPYYASDLVRRREYSIEEIWKTLEVVKDMNPTGFDQTIIEQLIKDGIVTGMGSKITVTKEKFSNVEFAENIQPISYKDRHAGLDFLVLANGPSLKEFRSEINLFIERYKPIVLGANYLGALFEPHYHAFTNKVRFTTYIDSVSLKSKLLIGESISKETISEYFHGNYETLAYKDIFEVDFDIKDGVIQTNCRSISVLLIGIAIVMGAERVFVAGMDGYKGNKKILFYDEKFEPEDSDLVTKLHNENEKFLYQIDKYLQDREKEGIHIITPTSHGSFYKRIDNYL